MSWAYTTSFDVYQWSLGIGRMRPTFGERILMLADITRLLLAVFQPCRQAIQHTYTISLSRLRLKGLARKRKHAPILMDIPNRPGALARMEQRLVRLGRSTAYPASVCPIIPELVSLRKSNQRILGRDPNTERVKRTLLLRHGRLHAYSTTVSSKLKSPELLYQLHKQKETIGVCQSTKERGKRVE